MLLTCISIRHVVMNGCLVLIVLIGSLLISTSASAAPQKSSRSISSALQQFTGPSNALTVEEVFTGTTVYDHNGTKPLKPASVMKVLTSIVALKKLGAFFDFDTTFSTFGLKDGVVQELTVIGGGDPLLRTEELHIISRNLKSKGLQEIKKLKIDLTRFEDALPPSGQRAYQAGTSALPLNFNSYVFEICPGAPGQKARVSWEPSEVDVSLIGTIRTSSSGRFNPILDRLSERRFKIGGEIPYRSECTTHTRSVDELDTFFGETFIGHLQSHGIRVGGRPVVAPSNPQASSFYVHSSQDLTNILQIQNLYSNNFVAEQILAAIGANKEGQLSRGRGRAIMSTYLTNLGFEENEFSIIDGSGLSHNNRLSTKQIVRALIDIYHDPILRSELESSLPVAGQTGTLRKRRFKGIMRAKTGTLNGVRSLAGYIYTPDPRRVYAFALLQNNLQSMNTAYRFEEKLAEAFQAG